MPDNHRYVEFLSTINKYGHVVRLDSYYKQHFENRKMVTKAITRVQLTLKEYIRRDMQSEVDIYTKILSHLVNTWTEVRVLELIYENGAFSDAEITELLDAKTAEERWLKALTIAYCKAYGVFPYDPSNIDITTPEGKKYDSLREIIKTDLLQTNQLRNRIAHGQWKYAFSGTLKSINTDLTSKLSEENIVKLQMKYKTFENLAIIIYYLAVSKPAFEKNFDKYFNRLNIQRSNFHNRDIEDYKRMLVRDGKTGKEKMRKNIRSE